MFSRVNKNSGQLVNAAGTDKHIHRHQIIINWDDLGAVTGPNETSRGQS